MTITKSELDCLLKELSQNKLNTSSSLLFGAIILLWLLFGIHIIYIFLFFSVHISKILVFFIAALLTYLTVKINVTKKKENKFYDIGKLNIVMLFSAFFILLSLNGENPDIKKCTERATIAGQWHSGIYHQCMGTPKGFRW